MKWFKHLTSAYTDIALSQIIEEFGMKGYGLWWITCELVGQQGENFRIKSGKNWKKLEKIVSKLPEKDIDRILLRFAELKLIGAKDLKNGVLSIKNMSKYADEWTTRNSGATREPLGRTPEQLRIDKIRLDKNIIYSEFIFQGKPCIKDKYTKKWKALDNGEWLSVDERFIKDIKSNPKYKKHENT